MHSTFKRVDSNARISIAYNFITIWTMRAKMSDLSKSELLEWCRRDAICHKCTLDFSSSMFNYLLKKCTATINEYK